MPGYDVQYKTKRIYVKQESVYGTDSVPDATNMIRTRNLAIKNYGGDKIQQEYDGDGGRARNSVNVNPHSEISFEFDFAGSGTKDTMPGYSDILLACGLDVVENAGVDTTITILDSITDSISAYHVRNESTGMQKAASLGMRGELGLQFNRGQIPIWTTRMLGSYIQPTKEATPLAQTPANQLKGIPVTYLNTPVLTLNSLSECFESVTIDNFGFTINYLNAPNCLGVKAETVPMTGSMVIKDSGYTSHNFFPEVESHAGVSEVEFTLQQGTTTGNILTLSSAAVQITDIDETELNGLKAWNMSFIFMELPTIVQT